MLAICKAMVEEGTAPDFIDADGSECGTEGGPLEYEDHVGVPLTEGLMTVHEAMRIVGSVGPGEQLEGGRRGCSTGRRRSRCSSARGAGRP